MKNVIRRLISLHRFVFIFIFAVIFLLAGTQKVSAEEQQKLSYLIKVNRACNTITIYEKDEKGEYTVPIKAMACSVGKGMRTITGTFQTKEKYRWKLLMGDVWGQYATRIVGGILFHSVYYYESMNPASLATKEFNKLGNAASHGCIRLTVGDAKWIYDNCSLGTSVTIYDDKKNPGPLGKPETVKLPTTVRWDPTDPNENNPFKDKTPVITGVKNIKLDWGEEIDLLDGVKAKSTVGSDITSKVSVNGDIDFNMPGEYEITYTVTDEIGKVGSKTITVTVGDPMADPVIKGVSDKVANGDDVIDRAFALTGVEAYSGDVKLNKNRIDVIINEVSEDDYYITYQVKKDGVVIDSQNAIIHIDREAPVLYGITDLMLEYGEIPTKSYVLSEITASDNYTKPEDIKISVSIKENPDGTYIIYYQAEDEAGNLTKQQAEIIN